MRSKDTLCLCTSRQICHSIFSEQTACMFFFNQWREWTIIIISVWSKEPRESLIAFFKSLMLDLNLFSSHILQRSIKIHLNEATLSFNQHSFLVEVHWISIQCPKQTAIIHLLSIRMWASPSDLFISSTFITFRDVQLLQSLFRSSIRSLLNLITCPQFLPHRRN